MHLFRCDPAAQYGSSHVAISRLLLRMNSDVIAVDIIRWLRRFSWIELKSNPAFQLCLEILRRPAVPQKKKLEPRPFAVLAQLVRVSKQLGNSANRGQDLIPANEGVERRAQIRLGRKSAAYAQRKANL